MYILIVTGSGLRKVSKLMLVQYAIVVLSGCMPYTCNITWVITLCNTQSTSKGTGCEILL